MRRLLPVLSLFAATLLHAQSSCPTQPPQSFGAHLRTCVDAAPCLAGTPAQLDLMLIVPDCPVPPPGTPPPPSCMIYQLQACDQVMWNFGDGSAPAPGWLTATHTYASAGSYPLTITITNSKGVASIAVLDRVVIAANPPTYVDFAQSQYSAPENAGSITFTLVRSGDLSRSSTVHYAHAEGSPKPVNQGEAISGNLTFAPGETTKQFTMKVYDDHVYTGEVLDWVQISATDGTLFHSMGNIATSSLVRYVLTEIDPQPTVNIADVRVSEGAGTADFAITLSAPIGVPVEIVATPYDGTAKFGSDYDWRAVFCPLDPGQTQCVMRIPIVNDDVPEPDETFSVRFDAVPYPAGPIFVHKVATVTIVNDDSALTPASTQIGTGASATLKLDIGQAPATPLTVTLHSSSPDVVEVPSSVRLLPTQSTATFSVHALKAGLSRITATVPGTNTPQSLITVADSVAVAINPTALTLRPGTDGSVSVSMQPPRMAAQNLSVYSTRPEVAAAPDSLTIPASDAAALNVHAVANGTATIWLLTGDGLSFPLDVNVANAPSLSRVEPASAPANGGSTTIFGDGLDATQCSVSFGDVAASSVGATAGGLSVVVPAHAPGAVDVNVVCGSARLTLPHAFTFFAPRRRAAG